MKESRAARDRRLRQEYGLLQDSLALNVILLQRLAAYEWTEERTAALLALRNRLWKLGVVTQERAR
jgi:hypothetical protein